MPFTIATSGYSIIAFAMALGVSMLVPIASPSLLNKIARAVQTVPIFGGGSLDMLGIGGTAGISGSVIRAGLVISFSTALLRSRRPKARGFMHHYLPQSDEKVKPLPDTTTGLP